MSFLNPLLLPAPIRFSVFPPEFREDSQSQRSTPPWVFLPKIPHSKASALLPPTKISPNLSEGLNDYFCIPESYLRFINLFEISIFNRWGQLVFYSTDKNFKWNGEYNGQIQPNTTYNYVIRYTTEAGVPFVIKGSVTVLWFSSFVLVISEAQNFTSPQCVYL